MFGLPRYAEVIEAYLAGLEELAARDPEADLSQVTGAASFFRYVDDLIGPHTISTMLPTTLAAVTEHGALARTVDKDLPGASGVLDRLARLGIDLDAVSAALEDDGIESFTQAFAALRGVLAAKAAALAERERAGA